MSKLTLHDANDDQAVISTDYDLARVIKTADYAKAMHNAGKDTLESGDKLVASVDPAVMHLWCQQRGVSFGQLLADQKLTKQFLEDPNNSQFRIWKGKL